MTGENQRSGPIQVPRGAALRERLVQSGLAMMEQGGKAGLSLRAVARQSGVSHMAPYGFFRSKNELLSAVAAAGFQLLRQRIGEAAVKGGASPRSQLMAVARAYVEFALDRPQLAALMFDGMVPPNERCKDLRAGQEQAFSDGAAIIAAGMEQGEFRRGDPLYASLCVLSLLHGFTQLAVGCELEPCVGRDRPSIEAAAMRMIEQLLLGLDA